MLPVQLKISGSKNEDILNVIFLNRCISLVDNINIYQESDLSVACETGSFLQILEECCWMVFLFFWFFDHFGMFLGWRKLLKTHRTSSLLRVRRLGVDSGVRARELEAPHSLCCHGRWVERVGFGSPGEHHARGERVGEVHRLPAFLLVRGAPSLSLFLSFE